MSWMIMHFAARGDSIAVANPKAPALYTAHQQTDQSTTEYFSVATNNGDKSKLI